MKVPEMHWCVGIVDYLEYEPEVFGVLGYKLDFHIHVVKICMNQLNIK